MHNIQLQHLRVGKLSSNFVGYKDIDKKHCTASHIHESDRGIWNNYRSDAFNIWVLLLELLSESLPEYNNLHDIKVCIRSINLKP